MIKESLYLEFIQELMERLNNENRNELQKELLNARSEFLSDYYKYVALQGLKTDCDLVIEAKQKIEILNELNTRINKLIG
jgi:hypothetical protein